MWCAVVYFCVPVRLRLTCDVPDVQRTQHMQRGHRTHICHAALCMLMPWQMLTKPHCIFSLLQYITRTCLAQAGLPTPRNSRISAPGDVAAAAAHVGFPSVIKPVSGAASIGVIRVDNEEQLQKAYERVVRDLSRAKVGADSAAAAVKQGGLVAVGMPTTACSACFRQLLCSVVGQARSTASCGSGHFKGVVPLLLLLLLPQVVAGALVEGNEEDEDDAAAGNAGSWIKVELMLEEVSADAEEARIATSTCALTV